MATEEDPFAVFDGGDHADTGGGASLGNTGAANGADTAAAWDRRDAASGALVFRPGTERALLEYVRNGLARPPADGDTEDNAAAAAGGDDDTLRTRVLRLVDRFCRSRHWMMHVGDEKGPVLQDFLAEAVAAARQRSEPHRTEPFLVLEVGTYCGYSLVRMVDTLLRSQADGTVPFHLVTVDVSASNQAVAREMARLAGVEEFVTFLLLENPSAGHEDALAARVAETIRRRFPDRSAAAGLDFVFLDHEKEMYLTDLRRLERARLVRAGTRVCADNVVFFGLEDYRQHVRALAARGVVETHLRTARLEYLDDRDGHLPDGLGA